MATYSQFGQKPIIKNQGTKPVKRRPPVNPAAAQFGEIRSAINPKPVADPSPAPSNPYAFNIKAGPKENVAWGNTIRQVNQLPTRGDQMADIENPASSYDGAMPGANDYMNRYFGSQGEPRPSNPYAEESMNYLRNAGGPPQRPDLMGPGSYNRPGGPSFNYGNADIGMFDPNSVGGFGDYNNGGWRDLGGSMGWQGESGPGNTRFNPGQITSPNNSRFNPSSISGPDAWGDFSGPQTQNFDYNQLIRNAGAFGGGGSNVPTVGRENVGRSGFEENQGFTRMDDLSYGGLNSGMNSARTLAAGGGFDVDSAALDAAFKRQYEMAAEAGGNKAIGRGFSPSGGTVGGMAIGKELGNTMATLAPELARLKLEAASGRQRSMIAGTDALGNMGGTAGGLANNRGDMLIGENQWFGDSQINQRGQDIDQRDQSINQNNQNTQNSTDAYGRSLSGVADLMRASGEMFDAGTRRGSAQADIGLQGYSKQTDRGAQFGNLWNEGSRINTEDYRAGTERTSALGNLWNEGSRINTADYEAGTNRSAARSAANNADYRSYSDRSRSRADSARADYEAGTSRRGVEGDIYNTGRSNQNTRFGMETDRTGMEDSARQAANELGFDYDQMDEQSKDWFNSQVNQRYQTEGNLANERFRDTNTAFGNQTQMMDERDSAYQARNLERSMGMASHALEVMKGDQMGQQAYNEMAMAARDGDIDTALQIYQIWVQDQQEGKQRRDASRGALAGAAIGAIGTIGGAAAGKGSGGGSAGGAAGAAAGGA